MFFQITLSAIAEFETEKEAKQFASYSRILLEDRVVDMIIPKREEISFLFIIFLFYFIFLLFMKKNHFPLAILMQIIILITCIIVVILGEGMVVGWEMIIIKVNQISLTTPIP
jgi:hypothetical protein